MHVVLHFSVFHVLADFRHAMATRPFAACMLLYCISYLIYIFVCSKLSPRGFGVVGRRVRWPLGSGGGPRARSAGGTCGLGVGWESAGLGSVLVRLYRDSEVSWSMRSCFLLKQPQGVSCFPAGYALRDLRNLRNAGSSDLRPREAQE